MAKRKIGELPSGNVRKKIYDHSELCFDEQGKPIIDPKTGKQQKKKIYISVTATSATEANRIKAQIQANKKPCKSPFQ